MKRAKILSASAGSGKTFQLALKYISDIIKRPEKFRNILAVTFTNKATEEMKSRILKEINTLASGHNSIYMEELRENVAMSESQIRQQALRARTLILHDYSRFSVLTIDRFFQRILRAFIQELGIDLNYNIELDTTTLLQRSADSLVESIVEDEELRRWMLEYAEERLQDGDRWDMRGDLQTLGAEIFKENAIERMNTDIGKEELRNIVYRTLTEGEEAKQQITNIAQEALAILQRHGLQPDAFSGKSRSFVYKFQSYANGDIAEPTATMLKAAEEIDAWYGKDATANVRTAASELQPLLKRICNDYRSAINKLNTAKILRENYRSYALLGDLYNKIKQICDQESIMVLGETKNILSTFVNDSNAPFIYEKVGNRYDYYMIDEFQDTSVREWTNLRPLLLNAMASNPETSVFIVGDVKQSIYRWRGGDWRLLKSTVQNDLGKNECEVKPLEDNWRSLPDIVEFNNRFIANVVARDNACLNEQAAVAYAEEKIDSTLRASLHDKLSLAYKDLAQNAAIKSDERGYIEVCAFDSKLTTPPFIEAIESAISRGYNYRDILILVRGATDGRKVADALFAYKERVFTSQGKQGFNLLTPDALTIENCEVVEFLIAVLRLAINPKNDIERGLYNRYLCRPLDTEFSDEELATLRHIAHLSPMEAFEHIVAHYNLNQRKEHIAYLQALHEQIISFSTSRIADIQHYLSWWDERGRLDTLRVEMTDDTIEITTIHKAKGLEAPVVIIPYARWDLTPRSVLQPIVWAKANDHNTATLGEFPVVYGRQMEQSAFTAEYYNELVMSHVDGINLLYVAVTRASQELYMYVPHTLNRKSKSSGDSFDNTSSLIINATTEICTKGEEVHDPADNALLSVRYTFGTPITKPKHKKGKEECVDRLLESYVCRTPQLNIHIPHQRLTDEGIATNSTSRHQGITLHRIFEGATNRDELYRAIDRLDKGCIIDTNEVLTLRQRIDEALTNPVVSEWFDTEWDDVKSEAEIISRSDLRRPDRVMIKGRRAIVVDYKFGEQESNSHTSQVARYIDLLRQMELYDTLEGYVWYINLGKVVGI